MKASKQASMRTTVNLAHDLLDQLPAVRRLHSLGVARQVMSVSHRVPLEVLPDLLTAAALHDIGYTVDDGIGFHPIDGAQLLRHLGYPTLICHLVAHHTLAPREAEERGLDLALFDPFMSSDPHAGLLLAVLTWADLTTSPTGQTVSPSERLAEIRGRYAQHHPVHRYVTRHQLELLKAGAQPPSG